MRNARRCGVPLQTIMEIGGWRSFSTLWRYGIVDETELAGALETIARHVEKGRITLP